MDYLKVIFTAVLPDEFWETEKTVKLSTTPVASGVKCSGCGQTEQQHTEGGKGICPNPGGKFNSSIK